jgi:hypothetical protein
MGHPMAKKGIRKRGDKFIKHQERHFNFQDNENENKKFHLQEDYEDEEDVTIEY